MAYCIMVLYLVSIIKDVISIQKSEKSSNNKLARKFEEMEARSEAVLSRKNYNTWKE